MALETATYIDGLVATNPAASDAISTADDHLRLIKSTVKATFPNLTGPVTVTQAQINDVVNKAPIDSPALTGTPTAPTAAAGTNTTQIASTAFVTTAIAAAMPSGGIIMWSGSVASIPSGWYLCNGSNGTPDLRDRFVIGAGNSYAVAATGGSKDAIVVSHTHTATSTVTDPGHNHAPQGGGSFMNYGGANKTWGPPGSNFQGYNATTTTNTTGISVATSVASTGSSGTDANLPPYYALAFIMKA